MADHVERIGFYKISQLPDGLWGIWEASQNADEIEPIETTDERKRAYTMAWAKDIARDIRRASEELPARYYK
jgi:hypothetical protein